MAFEILAPTSPYVFGDPDVPAPEFTASDQVGAVNWEVSEGTMDPATGDASTLSPLNHTATITVTATDTGTDPFTVATKTFNIEATLPFEWDYGVERDITPGFEPSIPEAGPPRFRTMQRTSQWPAVFKSRRFMDYATLRDFLILHETLPFWIEDKMMGERRKVYQDSALRAVGHLVNWMECSVQFKDYDYRPPTNIADAGPYATGAPPPLYDQPDYG